MKQSHLQLVHGDADSAENRQRRKLQIMVDRQRQAIDNMRDVAKHLHRDSANRVILETAIEAAGTVAYMLTHALPSEVP